MPSKIMHVGLDDTDSTRKGCTTYVAAILVEKLQKLGVGFVDYPNLIRLNPNVPWKTRGNGAVCLRMRHDCAQQGEIKRAVIEAVEEYSDLDSEGTDPGVVFLTSARVPDAVRAFSRQATTDIVSLRDALCLLKRFRGEALGFKKGRGIIGALAAIGNVLQEDHTYEMLAYRIPENCGNKRRVDEFSIFKMDEATAPHTFNNIDADKKRVIITPRGPDPILLGVRGETARIVKKAFGLIRILEPVERWVIFRTNQGTDAHLTRVDSLSQLKPYQPVIVSGTVSAGPRIVPRRHVVFSITDGCTQVDCAAYEPTGVLSRVARELMLGDALEAYGSVRPPSKNNPVTINLEKFRVLKLMTKTASVNPVCPQCGKRLESMGKNQGLRCRKCGSRFTEKRKLEVVVERGIREDLYVTSTRSQRHLTKPLRRYGSEKDRGKGRLISCWHQP